MEFADHKLISNELNADFYFGHPNSSWKGGTNENTNGLIRKHCPKGTAFQEVDPWEILRAEAT